MLKAGVDDQKFKEEARSYLAAKYGSVPERYVLELADAFKDYDLWMHGRLMMSEREYSNRVKAIHARIRKEREQSQ